MSDELDPEVSRWFAAASQPLADDDFQARVASRVQSSRGWLARGYSFRDLLRAGLSGIASGILTPLTLRPGYAAVMVVSASALTVWVGL
jgi:hypothetical protein